MKRQRLSDQLKKSATKQQDTGQPGSRPSVEQTFRKPENPLNAHINVRATHEFRDEVKLYSVQAGLSLQELVSEALTEYMQRHPLN